MHATHDSQYPHTRYTARVARSHFNISFCRRRSWFFMSFSLHLFLHRLNLMRERRISGRKRTPNPNHKHHGIDQRANQSTINEFTRTQCELWTCALNCLFILPLLLLLPYYFPFASEFARGEHTRNWPKTGSESQNICEEAGSEGSASNTCKVFCSSQIRLEQINTINLADGNNVVRHMTCACTYEKFKLSHFVSGEWAKYTSTSPRDNYLVYICHQHKSPIQKW